jgi:hypothetical protein
MFFTGKIRVESSLANRFSTDRSNAVTPKIPFYVVCDVLLEIDLLINPCPLSTFWQRGTAVFSGRVWQLLTWIYYFS